MVNSHGENYFDEEEYKEEYSGEPVTNANDKELQKELEGEQSADEAGDAELNIDAETWDGMDDGATEYDSTQTPNWISTIPDKYKTQAKLWASQRGVIKVTPIQKRQKFTYSTVAYIASKQEEPKTQIFPITDLQVIPHQITWDFFDTTEGRIGVSNAVEKHMICEFDVYLTELVATYWAFGENDKYDYGLATIPNIKRRWTEAVENDTILEFEADVEATKEFIDFRNTFLQQHSGWVCRFASHTFGVFQGVITDVNYNISGGESFAKWHVKIEEAVFLKGAYSTKGKKQESTTSDGSSENSGDASNTENVETSTE